MGYKAQKLAERMADATYGFVDKLMLIIELRPYAEAMVKAEEALGALLESPASFEDDRIDYAERQVLTESWTEAQSALADLRALMGEEEKT